jgi:hypothetical protein
MEEFRTEIRNMFSDLATQLRQSLQTQASQEEDNPLQEQPEEQQQELDMTWTTIMEELPSAPVISEVSWPKLFKLARELKRRAALMTAGRDLHDIHTVLFLVAHWPQLQQPTRNYAAHRLRLSSHFVLTVLSFLFLGVLSFSLSCCAHFGA